MGKMMVCTLGLLLALSATAMAEPVDFESTPNAAILFVSRDSAIVYGGEQGQGSDLVAIDLGFWFPDPLFPDLSLNFNFDMVVATGLATPENPWFLFGYFDDPIEGGRTHYITDVPLENQPAPPLEFATQEAIGNAIGTGGLLMGMPFAEMTTDDVVNFVFNNQGDAGASLDSIVSVFSKRGFNTLSDSEGIVFPFDPTLGPIGTFSFTLDNDGNFSAAFVPEPALAALFALGLACVVIRRRAAAA